MQLIYLNKYDSLTTTLHIMPLLHIMKLQKIQIITKNTIFTKNVITEQIHFAHNKQFQK